jgi:DNA polymerase I-like protein with 3'-5' exonuclease and polymerase domains
MSFLPSACFIVEQAQPWDVARGRIHPPRSAPGCFQYLTGYTLHNAALGVAADLDLAQVRESVIIATSKAVAREIGILVGDDGRDTIGVYQQLPDGRLAVLLPVDDFDKRRERSETWKQFWEFAVKRARDLAAGTVHRHVWGRLVDSGEESDIEAALRAIETSTLPIAVDVETVGDMPDMSITALGLATRDVSVSIPWSIYTSKVFGIQDRIVSRRIKARVGALLDDPRRTKVFHNGSFDVAVLSSLGITLRGPIEDTILAMKVLYGELYRNLQFSAGLAALIEPWKTKFKATREAALAKHEALVKSLYGRKLSKALDDWQEIPFELLLAYNAKDGAATVVLWDFVQSRINADPRKVANYEQLKRLAAIAAQQWLEGAPLSAEAHRVVTADTRTKLVGLLREWRKLVGPRVPAYGPGSDAALQKHFMQTLKAPKVQVPEPKKKKAPKKAKDPNHQSLSSYVLLCWDALAKKNPERYQQLADTAYLLYRIRKLRKNYTAFFAPLARKTHIYPAPSVTGTLGTRFSYSNPNIQQWPKEGDGSRFSDGKKYLLAPDVKQLIIAPPGMLVWESDFNALELRAVGYRTKFKMWFDWMEQNLDMHIEHVFLMFGLRISKDNDPDGLRQIAKVAIYARFYNVSANPDAVVKQLKPKMPSLTRELVVEVFSRLDKAIPAIPNWHQEAAEMDRQRGYVETGLGGWRIPSSHSKPDENRNRSFEIQSTVGHIVGEAECRLDAPLRDIPGSRMLFQVHDSFVGLCREDRLDETCRTVREHMEWEVPELWGNRNLRFPVEIKYGPSWGKLSKWKEAARG